MWFEIHFYHTLWKQEAEKMLILQMCFQHLWKTPHWPRTRPPEYARPAQLLQEGHILKAGILVGQSLDQHVFRQLEYFLGVIICLALWISEKSDKMTNPLMLLLLLLFNPKSTVQNWRNKTCLFPRTSKPTLRHLHPDTGPWCGWGNRATEAPWGPMRSGVVAAPKEETSQQPLSLILSDCKGITMETSYTFSSTHNATLWVFPTGNTKSIKVRIYFNTLNLFQLLMTYF